MATGESVAGLLISENVYIALGSNLGDRFAHLQRAVRQLTTLERVVVVRASPVYESDALTLDPDEVQPAYLNAVVELQTSLAPAGLLDECLAIERRFGRRRTRRWEPRTIDLDVLAFGDRSIERDDLKIPHPRLSERRFVLRPFADLAPTLRLPAPLDATVYSLLERTPDRGEVRRYPRELTLPR